MNLRRSGFGLRLGLGLGISFRVKLFIKIITEKSKNRKKTRSVTGIIGQSFKCNSHITYYGKLGIEEDIG